VALEWARWGRRRGFLYGDPGLQRELKLHAFAGTAQLWDVSDDLTYAPPRAVDALAVMFVGATVSRHTLTPADPAQRASGTSAPSAAPSGNASGPACSARSRRRRRRCARRFPAPC
jgi:hypothetical protein